MAVTDPPADVFAPRAGVVDVFDDLVGAGTVRDADGGREWWFHCTRIAGGSRSVRVGDAVTYVVRPGPTGLEAVDLRSLEP